jgi:hypothetical protein
LAKFQLIVQFPEGHFATFDKMIALEMRIAGWLPRTAVLDGHDIGSGTVNFFIDVNAPEAVAQRIRSKVLTRVDQRHCRIAYRPSDGEIFTNLWPRRDPRVFKIYYSAAENPFTAVSKRKIPKRSKPGTRRPRV